jgi:hypothetical protein
MSRAFDPAQLGQDSTAHDPHWENHWSTVDEEADELERRHAEELEAQQHHTVTIKVARVPKPKP